MRLLIDVEYEDAQTIAARFAPKLIVVLGGKGDVGLSLVVAAVTLLFTAPGVGSIVDHIWHWLHAS